MTLTRLAAIPAACLAAMALSLPNAFADDPADTQALASPEDGQAVGVLGSLRVEGGAMDAAVVVGVDDYVFVSDIAGAADNATEWYKWLKETREVPQDKIHLVRNHEATLENLRDVLDAASREVGPGGTLWFVFVGHGAPGLDGKEGVLVGADAQQNPKSLYARSLSQSELLEALGKGARARAIVVLDACFSGRDAAGRALIDNLQPLIPSSGVATAQPDTIVLTAAANDEFAGPLPATRRPAFSYLLLGALRGWGDKDGDGSVTVDEAIRYTQNALKVVVTDRSQRPSLVAGDPSEVLAREATEAAPDLDNFKAATTTVTVVAPSPVDGSATTLPILVRFEYGVRWLGTKTFEDDMVEFQHMEFVDPLTGEDKSMFADLAISELSRRLMTNYAGITMHNNLEGFGWSVSFGLTWQSETDTTANLTADESLAAEEARFEAALRAGYEARITGLYLFEMNVEPHYLVRFDPVTFEVALGFGGMLGGIGVDNGPDEQLLTGVSNTSAMVYGLTVPAKGAVTWRFYENWAATLMYMYHVMPFDSHAVIVGLGPSSY